MINRVILVGRLTKDVEVRKTQSGLSVASFTVACNNRRGGQNETTDFLNCVAWRQTADFLGSYARKGALVGVEGRLQSRSYDDRDGRRVYVTEVVCDNVQLLESRSQSEQRMQTSSYDQPSYSRPSYQQPSYNGGGYQQQYPQQPATNDTYSDSGDEGSYGSDGMDISSDDLPF